MFAAFTEEFISAPFTEQIFHYFIPALSDLHVSFPFEAFLSSLKATIDSSSSAQSQAPWILYYVLSAGENCLGWWLSVDVVYTSIFLFFNILPVLVKGNKHGV